MHLYELPQAQALIDEMLEESEGELTPEIEEAMAALDEEIEHKIDWVGGVVASRLAKATVYDIEIKRLQAAKRSNEKGAENLRKYLKETLDRLQTNRVAGKLFTATVQKNSQPKITWTRTNAEIPPEYARVYVEPDNEKVREALRSGQPIPSGFVVEQGTHLRIR